MPITPNKSLNVLVEKHDLQIPNILAARTRTDTLLNQLQAAFESAGVPLTDGYSTVVLNGSLARGEATGLSDIDWTLLAYGQDDEVAAEDSLESRKQAVASVIDSLGHAAPGKTGVFGDVANGANLLSLIGGDADINKNMTRRMLLLLESTSLDEGDARRQFVEKVVRKYVDEDTPFRTEENLCCTPRFLLNDVVRFWRTMAVDYASKKIASGPTGWALRNAKLRMSRKLIFVAGLLMCYRFQFKGQGEAACFEAAMRRLLEDIERTPLEVLACHLLEVDAKGDLVRQLLESYDKFLGVLQDEPLRAQLSALDYAMARESPEFGTIRDMSHEFHAGLKLLFFGNNVDMSQWIEEYGVF